jgi:hypothetical protein
MAPRKCPNGTKVPGSSKPFFADKAAKNREVRGRCIIISEEAALLRVADYAAGKKRASFAIFCKAHYLAGSVSL